MFGTDTRPGKLQQMHDLVNQLKREVNIERQKISKSAAEWVAFLLLLFWPKCFSRSISLTCDRLIFNKQHSFRLLRGKPLVHVFCIISRLGYIWGGRGVGEE